MCLVEESRESGYRRRKPFGINERNVWNVALHIPQKNDHYNTALEGIDHTCYQASAYVCAFAQHHFFFSICVKESIPNHQFGLFLTAISSASMPPPSKRSILKPNRKALKTSLNRRIVEIDVTHTGN